MSSLGGFLGFGIRIDVFGQGAIYGFTKLRAAAMATLAAMNSIIDATVTLEQSMAELTRVVSINADSLEQTTQIVNMLEQEILQLSSNSVFSIEELADSLNLLMRAGEDAYESLKMLKESMVLTTAVGGDLSEVSQMFLRMSNIWKTAGQPIHNMTDKIVQIEKEFMMTTEDLMTSLNMAGAIAAEAGLSFSETATIIGLLTQQGIKASTAGTVLRQAISSLLDPSQTTIDALSSLGINMDKLSELDIIDQFKVISEALGKVTDAQERASIAFKIFGVRGVNILPVLRAMGSQFDELVNKIENSEGKAAEAAEAYEQTLVAKLIKLRNSFVATISAIGSFMDNLGGLIVVLGTTAVIMTSLVRATTWLAGTMAVEGLGGTLIIVIRRFFLLNAAMLRSIGITGVYTSVNRTLNLVKSRGLSLVIAKTIARLRATNVLKIYTLTTIKFIKTLVVNITLKIRDIAVTVAQTIWYNTAGLAVRVYTAIKNKETMSNIKNIVSKIANTTATIGQTVATGLATAATWAFNASLVAMNVLLSPLTLIILSLALVFVFLYKQFKKQTAIGKFITSIWQDMKDILQDLWLIIKTVGKVLLFTLAPALAPVIASIVVFISVLKIVLLILKGLIRLIILASKWLWEKFLNTKAGAGFIKFLNTLKNVFFSIINGIIKAINWVIRQLNKAITFFGSEEDKIKELELAGEEKGKGEGTGDTTETEGGTTEGEEETDYVTDSGFEFEEPTTEEEVGGETTRTSGRGTTGLGPVTVYIEISPSMNELLDAETLGTALGREVIRQARRRGDIVL